MKTFIFKITTNGKWEVCNSIYLVTADSKEEAEAIFKKDSWDELYENSEILSIEEADLSVKGQIKIQDGFDE